MSARGPLHQTRRIGRLTVHAIQAGGLKLDGGAMFGIVPKPLWERRVPADERNRIQLGMRCLLIEHEVGLVLIDNGAGNKEDAKFHEIYAVENDGGGEITRLLPAFTHGAGSLRQLSLFSAGSILGSNIFSNVPFVMLLRGWLPGLPHARLLWLTLAMSSTFAGNLTLVGSVANLIVAQRAREECPLSALQFLKVGLPSTLLTTLAGVLILWLYSLLHWV